MTPAAMRGERAGFHVHECRWCGTRWEHPDGCDGMPQLHDCPRCERVTLRRLDETDQQADERIRAAERGPI